MIIQKHSAHQLSHCQARGQTYDVFYPESVEDLDDITSNVWIVGGGTNTLFISPQQHTFISLERLNSISINSSKKIVTCGAGCTLPLLNQTCKRESIGGLEFTWPIPATIGGAIYQNFGAYGQSIGQLVTSVTCFNPADHTFQTFKTFPSESYFQYRDSFFKQHSLIITQADFKLSPSTVSAIQDRLSSIASRREQSYPLKNTLGSIFKNPSDDSAGRLIDNAGCKGLRVGGAVVSSTHANVIVNDNRCTGRDMVDLIQQVREKVLQKTGIELELEVMIY